MNLSYSIHILLFFAASFSSAQKTPVTLEEVLGNEFAATPWLGWWDTLKDSTIIYIDGKSVVEYDVANNVTTTIVEGADLEAQFPGQSLQLSLSHNRQSLLVEHGRRNYWRHSYFAKYDIFHLPGRNFTKLQPTGFGETDDHLELQFVRWSPTGDSLAFVYGNNIYYKKSYLEAVQQITTTGSSAIFNGICDWVYEEEMFATPVALWFSKDSSRLAFVTFDDTDVPLYQWPIYGAPGKRSSVYPVYAPIRYPKVGFSNPTVTLNIIADLDQPTVYKPVQYPINQLPELRHVIGTVDWISERDFLVKSFNRVQTTSVWNLCNGLTGLCEQVYSYTQVTPKGWIDPHHPTVSADGSRFLILEPVQQINDPNSRHYKHIVSIPILPSTTTSTPVTAGSLHVDFILGWDETNDKIYFQGTGLHPEVSDVADPSERHVYYVSASGSNNAPTCITCQLKTGANDDCRANAVSFSYNFQYYTHTCQGPWIPEISTRRTDTNQAVKVWEDNASLRTKLDGKSLPTKLDMEVPLDGGFVAKVRLYYPPGFDSSIKYPLLIDVYGGPDSQKLTQNYLIDWGTYMVSSGGIIYASIDGRGSGRQSQEQKFANYRYLGSVEMLDQIQVTKYLQSTYYYIDAQRTAIWGWSYGGYATTMILGRDTEKIFKCGVAVAPVSSWLYYDTIHTERYLGLPTDEDNFEGYNASSVLNYLENIRGREYLIIHGNADDNVHYQQSMMITRALEQKDIMFDQLSYPDEAHSINGPGMRRHLYHQIERFLTKQCFSGRQEGPGTTTTEASGTTTTEAPNWSTTTQASTTTDDSGKGGSTVFGPSFVLILVAILISSNLLNLRD